MTIKMKQERKGKIEIDLTGPDGNSYALMGYAKNFYKQMGKSDDWAKLREEMTSNDYENLLRVFDREFGEFVDLLR